MKTILVVDDDNAQRTILQKELEPEGYRVRLAESGSEALDLIRKEMIDLVVLDIMMPEMDGLELLGKMLAFKPGLPVVFYTAFDSYQDSFFSWAADAYVLKDPDVGNLKAKLKELLGGDAA